ncbi:hypothetical protein DXG01_001404 [Tephrocybe rancida]|nr:hypothetical protein DXG01_001404 [Tephrocybe rancida]
MADTIIVPLTGYDTYHDNSGVTVSYIVQSVDDSSLRNAALRVVDKWRLMAGHIERFKDQTSWYIRVPIQGSVSHRLGFTTRKSKVPLDSSYFVDKADPIRVVLRPPGEYFRHPSVPYTLKGYCSSDAPIVSIHVTEFPNCACIGISFPHSVVDSHGMGQFIHALDDELHDKPWNTPTFSETNVFRGVLDDLQAAAGPMIDARRSTLSPSPRHAREPSALINALILESRIAYEIRYRNLDTKMVYMPAHALAKLVEKTKGEAERSGFGRISTGDVVSAWILKATYSNETDNRDVHVGVVVSARKVLSQYPAMGNYSRELFNHLFLFKVFSHPVDNAVGIIPFPSINKQELAKKSLSEVAVWHRKGLEPFNGDTSWIRGYDTYFKTNRFPEVLRPRGWGQEPIAFTSPSISRFDNIDFGSTIHALWLVYTPTEPIHVITINKLHGGYLLHGNLRRKRWKAVAEAVQQLAAVLDDPLAPDPVTVINQTL